MRNPNPKLNLHEFVVSWRFLIVVSFLLFCSSVDGLVVDSGHYHTLEWKVLTKRNFSSQIRLHQRVLLMVTVPWSGESRTLMKEIAHAAHELKKLDDLKVMVIYKNKEKMLANALDATEMTTILCYYHSVPYKYSGRLRAQNILASINYLMHLHPEELPLISLKTPEDLDTFLESTDKAVLVLEFCGWSQKLLTKWKTNGTENAFLVKDIPDSGTIVETNLLGERNQTLASSVNMNMKVAELKNEKLSCGVENGLSGNPLLDYYILTNHSAPSWTESSHRDPGISCSLKEFQRFESFFLRLTKFAQEFFLPPERRRFGLISVRTLLPYLGVQVPDSWLAILHHAGCRNCSKIFEEGDDLKNVLQMHPALVTELESEGDDPESGLPADKPSIILFIDRSSESSTTRRKSKEALEVFRKFALHNQFSYEMALQNSITHGKHLGRSFEELRSRTTSDSSMHPKKKFSPVARIDELKNKISVMIINEGGNAALDDVSDNARDSSIQDILVHLLQQKKKAKLSLLAKEVGFQLLSDDFEVKIADLALPQTDNNEVDKLLPEVLSEKTSQSSINLEDKVLKEETSVMELKEQIELANLEPSQLNKKRLKYIVSNSKLIPQAPVQTAMNRDVGFAQDTKVEESFSWFNELDVEGKHNGFDGFYFFFDGNYQLLRSLTSGSKIPSMIILDPISEQHYVFPEGEIFSYSSLCSFFDAFLNGSLFPYQLSEYSLKNPREAIRPPLVNLDFHEVDSIPRVTIHTFSKMVLGLNESDTQNTNHAWMKDVLVLFSTSWCGFCQRMELVVREVFRSFKGYTSTLMSGPRERDLISISDGRGDPPFTELPLIFLMDCTLNDCNLLLKSMGQKELFPTLMLFPAQRKTAITYHGDMSVTSVIKFIADHGTNSLDPIGGKGQDGNRKRVISEDASTPTIHEDEPVSEAKCNDILLINKTPRKETKIQNLGSHPSVDNSPTVIIGTILIATDKLLTAPPFGESLILIVQADHAKGFQGLIVNKHISWEAFKGLEKGVEQVSHAPLSFGGPIILQELPLVSLTRRVPKKRYTEVLPNVYFLDQLATIEEIEGIKTGNRSADDYWFFLGYSGWGSDQLFVEIAEGSWRISDDDPLEQLHWPGNINAKTA